MRETTLKAPPVSGRLLYGPGPAMVEPRALEAMRQPALGIRDPQFLEITGRVRDGLRYVFGTRNQMTFPIPGSGSGGMEAAVKNFVDPGQKFGVFAAGHFANRITEMARRHGANVVRCERPWGQVFSEEDATSFLERERPHVVAFVQAETSTGAYQSGRAIVPAARKVGALVIADTVTSLGAMPVEVDNVDIDVAFSCTQKGLSCPAGLSPITMSQRAWEKITSRKQPIESWYFDLGLMANYFEPPHVYQHTPSPPLYYALEESLNVIQEEGLAKRWERHRKAGQRLAQGLTKLGFSFLVERPEDRLWHLATVMPPAGCDEAQVRQRLLANYNIEVSPGLGEVAGKVLRIGAMGPLATEERVDFLLEALAACV